MARIGEKAVMVATTAYIALAAPQAFAQTAGASAEPAGEVITVTARRREESAQDVPIALSVVSAEDIVNRSAIRISDALETIPNLFFESNSLGGSTINIRGVSSSTNNFGIESAVAVYLDDVYLARPNLFDQGALDVRRIEVLRGPQGTLFGRNTIAGVINISTADPSDSFTGEADATYGRYDLFQFRAGLSAPLGEKAGFRISGGITDRDGWFKQLTPGLPDFNNQDSVQLRAKLRLEPAEGFDATFTAHWSRDRSVSGNNDVIAGPLMAFDPSGPDEGATSIAGRERREFFLGSLRMNYDLGGHVLTSVTAYQTIDYDRFNDQDYTAVDILSTGSPEKDRFFSQEIRLASPGDRPFTYVVGGYYSDGRVEGTTRAVLGAGAPLVLGIGNIPGYTESEQTDSRIDATSLAAFGSATYKIGERLTLAGGLRYTSERKRLDYRQTVTPFFLAPGVPLGIIYAFAVDVPAVRQKLNEDALSGDASASFRLSKAATVYARFSRGYKAGGFDSTTSTVADPGALSFGAEKVDLYEVGLKSRLADGAVTLNAAAFRMEYRDKQEQIFNGVAFLTSNAAGAKIEGAELEVGLRPARGLRFDLSLGYADGRYGRFVDPLAGTDYSGNRLPYSARWTAGAAAEYGFALSSSVGVTLRGDANYRSDAFTTVDNDPTFVSRGVVQVNLRAGLELDGGRYGIYAWGRNVFNERYVAGGFDFLGSTYVYRNMPASWGIELRGRF
jgi:iron complex outermembrane receptor protein